MLRLTLIRHAKAEPGHPGQEDWNRALEASGQRDARKMGARLKSRALKPDRIISSPAVRALDTATIIARQMHVAESMIQQDERLYLAGPKDMMSVVRELGGAAKHVMIFGHNPGITEFADRLSSERSLDNMPTCAVYTLEVDIEDWSEFDWSSGLNADLDYPKKAS